MDYRDANSIERDRIQHYNRPRLNVKPNNKTKRVVKIVKPTFEDFLNSEPNIDRLNDQQQRDIYELYHA
jgi:hypothetical protein